MLATTLFNIGKVDDALASINKAIEAEPENKKYKQLKSEMSSASR